MLTDPCTLRQLAWVALPPAAGGLLAILAVALTAVAVKDQHGEAEKGGGGRARGWLRRAANTQLPPARFWVWWCGGMSGADAALVALWLAVNGIWLSAILTR